MARDYQGRIFAGILIIVIGVIFLLGSLDKVDVGDLISEYWPLILIAVGLWHILAHNFRQVGTGLILITIGSVFMLINLGILGTNFWSVFWPVLIIAVGLWILLKPRFKGFEGKVPEIKDDDLDAFVMFAGINRRLESKEFRGGKATALFGGIELDFYNAKLAGNQATVDLTAMFGGIDVRVPRNWKVVVDSHAILGGVDDKHRTESPDQIEATLLIKATAIFGGIDIKN
jgi:predicted membrane protein